MNAPAMGDYDGGCGFSNNPLLWLITLGFLGRGFGFGGYGQGGVDVAEAAGIAKANEGISCLAAGQADLRATQSFDRVAAQMDATGNRTVSAIGDLTTDFNSFSRDLNTVLCDGFGNARIQTLESTNALAAQLAQCCCENRLGTERLGTAIAMQTNELSREMCSNTQKIIDTITTNRIVELTEQLNDAKSQNAIMAQTAALTAIINNACTKSS